MADYARRGSPRLASQAAGLRRLRWLGIGLPMIFLLGVELFRYAAIEAEPIQHAEHLALAGIVAIGILIFGLLMFSLIERAEQRVVRQNRELTAINAVSTAVQGELGVEHIIDSALHTVIERTGATEASVTVFGRGAQPHHALERRVVRAAHAPVGFVGSDMPHLVDIPLAHGTVAVGRMRLHLDPNAGQPDMLTSATLSNIGHQLACSIEIGQLIDDLQRRTREGEALYDVLLRVSSQRPLADTLAAVTRHARELLDGQSAELGLTPAAATLLEGTLPAGASRYEDGSASLLASAEQGAVGAAQGASAADAETLRVALVTPDATLGDLALVRLRGAPFSPREWEFLNSLAELAVIAVTSARMRETERQGAILAERERIAREMHDSLAQVLGVIHLELRGLRPKVAAVEPALIADRLAELADIAEAAYRDVREAILGLRESSRIERGLFDSLRAYLERYGHQSGVPARLETAAELEPRLSPQAEVHVIRVIQEALTNVRKHAAATQAVVRVSCDNGWAIFEVADDGHGFDVARTAIEQDGGFGLHAMKERMALVGGTLTIDSAPGRGTRVLARVPRMLIAVPPTEEAVRVRT